MKQSTYGIVSLILGIVGILLSCITIGIIPCVIGVILAVIGLVQKDRRIETAIAGLVCSIIGIGLSLFMFMFLIFAYKTYDNDKKVSETSYYTEKEDIELQDSDFEETEYSLEYPTGDTLYLLVLKNNSPETANAHGDVVAYDAEGNILATSSAGVDALGSGKEQVMSFYFSDLAGVDHFGYNVDYKVETDYEDVGDDIEIQETINGKSVVITCTNNGDEVAEFVEAYVLFFKGEQLVEYNWTYLYDVDFELRPGKTVSDNVYCFEDFDSIKCYYSGRR